MHGIRIEFNTEKGYKRTATYLPEVAPEQGEIISYTYYYNSFLSNIYINKGIYQERKLGTFIDLSQNLMSYKTCNFTKFIFVKIDLSQSIYYMNYICSSNSIG